MDGRTGEEGWRNIPITIQSLLGMLLIDQTVAVVGRHQLLVGTGLYTKGDHLAVIRGVSI